MHLKIYRKGHVNDEYYRMMLDTFSSHEKTYCDSKKYIAWGLNHIMIDLLKSLSVNAMFDYKIMAVLF